MRWKRSAREKILKDITFDKKGEAAAPATSTGSGGGGASWFKLGMYSVLFVIVLLGLFLGWSFFNSAAGAQFVESSKGVAEDAVTGIQRAFGLLEEAQLRASGDFFSNQRNDREDTLLGITLEDLDVIGGSNIIPPGQGFTLEYIMEYHNVELYEGTIEADFFCQFEKEDGEIVLGDVLPGDTLTLLEGNPAYCQFSGEDTADLDDKSVTARGWFEFDFATFDARLPVYFISGELADSLRTDDVDFFDRYNLGVERSDLLVINNGEPLSVGVGVDGENNDQPLVVRSDNEFDFNTVGITITNEWDGEILELQEMVLLLPDGVTLDEENNALPSFGCPFEFSGEYSDGKEGFNEYNLADEMKEDLFNFYFNDALAQEGFGKGQYHTFQCFLEVDETILGSGAYTDKEIVVDLEYRYKVDDKTEAMTIRSQLVEGEDDTAVEDSGDTAADTGDTEE